jgi:hypothetical protein
MFRQIQSHPRGVRTGIAQVVERLATGWTVRGSSPGGGRDFTHPSVMALGPTQPSLVYNVYLVFFPGLKRPGRSVGYQPYLTPRLKKE